MNSQQIQDISLMYEAVYNDELREKAEEYNNTVYDEDIIEVATEYFYTYGLNEDGIDILIEKVGLDNFVEFVYDLSEDLVVLSEARAAKKRTGGKSYEEVKAEIDAREAKKAAKKKATKSAEERKETERREPESKGPDTEAKEEQPKSKKPIRDAIARQILAGMKRHREATQTAGNLARETGKTLGKLASVTHEAGRRAGEHVKKHGLKSLANEEYVDEDAQKVVGQALDAAAKNPVIKAIGKVIAPVGKGRTMPRQGDPQYRSVKEEVDIFDVILEHLVAEGYADTNKAALAIMANMSEEWKQSIVEAPGEWFGGLRDKARASKAAQMQSSKPTPKSLPNVSSPFAKPASRTDSGKLTTYGAGGGAAAERGGQTRAQVMQQGAKNLERKNKSNPGPNFGR